MPSLYIYTHGSVGVLEVDGKLAGRLDDGDQTLCDIAVDDWPICEAFVVRVAVFMDNSGLIIMSIAVIVSKTVKKFERVP